MRNANKKVVTCCSFPTQIVAVDDEVAVADSLRFTLGAVVKSFSNPVQALEILSSYQPKVMEELWLGADQTSDLWDGLHKQPAMMDIKKIANILQNKNKDNDISVVIVDYQMPEMNGLELLRQLQDKPFKKILLTGEGTTALAVDAFNAGLIDQFFRKDDVELQQKIREAVYNLKQIYFIDLCKKSLSLLSEESAVFSSIGIAHFFYEKMTGLNISEFYLLDMQGSFLLLDKNKNRKHMLIHTKEYVEMFANLAQEDNASPLVIDAIVNKKAFPYFGDNQAYWNVKGQDWDKYLQPLEEIKINNTIFYMAVF